MCIRDSLGFVAEQSMAQGPNNLFSQYYTQGNASAHAAMYPAPHPVPSHVGAAYGTYQPLMPHEMMYAHRRDYYNYYASPESFYCETCRGPGERYDPGYGYTKTTVRWQSGCNSVAPLTSTLLPFTQWQKLWRSKQSVPRSIRTCFGGLNLDGKIGLNGVGCARCGGRGCGICNRRSGFEGDAGFGGNFGYEGGYDTGAGCSDCIANDWRKASQSAAARTAQAMQNRYR